jgi:hypothetical protein
MGMINIQMYGSFPKKEKSFGAIEHGHAHAINEAIAWLSEQMKQAINSGPSIARRWGQAKQGVY